MNHKSGVLTIYAVRWAIVPLGLPQNIRVTLFEVTRFYLEINMHLLYLDDSGSIDDPTQKYFVLAGISVFERQTHWIETKLHEIATRFDSISPHSIELHGSPMRSGREGWKRFPLKNRLQAIKDSLEVVVENHHNRNGGVRLFAAIIKKDSMLDNHIEHVFEQLVTRFDMFLKRRYTKYDDPQRGLILFDKSSTERRIQTLARDFKYEGHTWGKTKNYVEVPVFLDSKSSRLIQLADLIAYSIFRFYEHGDDTFFSIISECFDSEGGTKHGLYLKE
jgi:hypothetical protein